MFSHPFVELEGFLGRLANRLVLLGYLAVDEAVIISGASQSAAEPAQSSAESRPSEPGPEDHPSDKPTPA